MGYIATPQQFLDALAALDGSDRAGMFAAARFYCRGNCGFQNGEDLVNELVVRVVDRKRNWDLDVPIMAFLVLGFRSVADGGRRLQRHSMPHVSLDECAENPDLRAQLEARPHPSAEDEAAAEQLRRLAQSAFDFATRSLVDDPLALQILDGLASDMTPAEMRADFGVGKHVFHAARARVNARLSIWAERQAGREQASKAAFKSQDSHAGRTQ